MTDRLEGIKRKRLHGWQSNAVGMMAGNDIDWMIGEIERLRADEQSSFENLKKERSQLARQVSNLSSERKCLLEQVSEKRDEIEALNEKVKSLQGDRDTTICELQKEISELNTDLHEKREKVKDLLDQINDYQDENQRLKRDNDVLDNKCNLIEQEMRKLEKEKSVATATVKELEMELGLYKQEYNGTAPELRDAIARDFAMVLVNHELHKFNRVKVADVCELAWEFADEMTKRGKGGSI